jgi:uncharacterized protein (DUF1810 family)
MPPEDPFNLSRFVEAQAPVIDQVRRELSEGLKRTHWMWYIFPQLGELGSSPTARFYGIDSIDEAAAYLNHPVLGPRLIDCVELMNEVQGRSAYQILGSPDDMKFHSSVTLFGEVDGAPADFGEALKKYFDGAKDPLTMQLIRA